MITDNICSVKFSTRSAVREDWQSDVRRGQHGERASATARPRAIQHLTPTEHAARGKQHATSAAPSARRVGTRPQPGRPRRAARTPGGVPRARTRADPIRPDARIAVRVLPWRSLSDGGGSRRHAPVRTQRPALRRRTPLQLRCVRITRATPGVRHQRFRRDPSRPVGVGRETACLKLRDCRPANRPEGGRVALRRALFRRRVPERHDPVRRDARARRLVRPPRSRGRACRPDRRWARRPPRRARRG